MAKKHEDKNNTENADALKALETAQGPETLGTADKPKATEPTNGNPPPAASSQQAKPKKKRPKKNKKKFDVVDAWEKYFGVGEGGLKDWQRLCDDLGLQGDLSSKKKCKKVCPTGHIPHKKSKSLTSEPTLGHGACLDKYP
jgi:hypothetical protein